MRVRACVCVCGGGGGGYRSKSVGLEYIKTLFKSILFINDFPFSVQLLLGIVSLAHTSVPAELSCKLEVGLVVCAMAVHPLTELLMQAGHHSFTKYFILSHLLTVVMS